MKQGHRGHLLPAIPSTAPCQRHRAGHSHGEIEEKSEGDSVRVFFSSHLTFGHFLQNELCLPPQSTGSRRAAQQRARIHRLALPQRRSPSSSTLGAVRLSCSERQPETPPPSQAICPCTSLLSLFVTKVFLPLPDPPGCNLNPLSPCEHAEQITPFLFAAASYVFESCSLAFSSLR